MGARSLDYVRTYYGLDVKRGTRVTVFGRPGRVTSGCDQYVRVRRDGEKRSSIFHARDVIPEAPAQPEHPSKEADRD